MSMSDCPRPEVLDDYTLGLLDEPEFGTVAAHLETCGTCQDAVATKGGGNSVECPDLDLPPPAELGEYQLGQLIGKGGMGAVYKARNPTVGRTVALKLITAATLSHQYAQQRFEKELRAQAKVSSPYVVHLLNASEDKGRVFLVQEFVDGQNLGQLVKQFRNVGLDNRLAESIAACVAKGLSAIHGAGFVHRDLHPGNVLFSKNGDVKITDFGLARSVVARNGDPTRGTRIGEVRFVAPEQATTGATSVASDVFSLGCLLLYLLSGEHLERDTKTHAVLHVRRRLSHLPRRVRHLLGQMLENDPARRPPLQSVINRLRGPLEPEQMKHLLDSYQPERRLARGDARMGLRRWIVAAAVPIAIVAAWTSTRTGKPAEHPVAPRHIEERYSGEIKNRPFFFTGTPGEYSFEIRDDVHGTLGRGALDTLWFVDGGGGKTGGDIAKTERDCKRPSFTAELPPGTHRVSAKIGYLKTQSDVIDPKEDFAQQDHVLWIIYSYSQLTFVEPQRADLGEFRPGDQIRFRLTVRNVGSVASNAGAVGFYVNRGAASFERDSLRDSVKVGSLAPSGSTTATFSYTIPVDCRVGQHCLAFHVDYTDKTPELEELEVLTHRTAEGRPYIARADPYRKPEPDNKGYVTFSVAK